jgi:hypothetical protein
MWNNRIIDVHAHIGDSAALEVKGKAEDVLRLMDKNNIYQSIISPIPGFWDPKGIEDTRRENDNVAKAVQKYPNRFPCGLAILEPRHGEENLKEIDRVLGNLGLRGLMFHHDFHGCTLDHPIMFTILEYASKYKDIIVMIHTCQLSALEPPFRLERLAKAFPNLTFINAHAGMDHTQLSSSIEVAKHCTNVYIDTCLSYHHLWPIERLVKELGFDRILFGTDSPYYHTTIDKVIIETADISDDAKDAIYAKNAIKLFGIRGN